MYYNIREKLFYMLLYLTDAYKKCKVYSKGPVRPFAPIPVCRDVERRRKIMFFDDYDTPVFRPPSEAESFILRVTRGCAHNKCTYCNMYRGVPFQVLTNEEIARQIAMAYTYNRDGVRRVFLADGDALCLATPRLLGILEALHRAFPNLQRVSSYAAPKDILRKSPEEMKQLSDAGLKLLYYGMESGDSETLKAINKGADGPQSIEAGRRVIASGMKLSIMVILGIAGKEGSERHALATAEAISEIRPTMLSALCLMLYRGSEISSGPFTANVGGQYSFQLIPDENKVVTVLTVNGEETHMVWMPYSWGFKGLAKGPSTNYLTIDALDPNTQEQEFKACLVNIVKA